MESDYRVSTGFAGTPYITDRAHAHRSPRRRLPAVAGARVPVVGCTRSRRAPPRVWEALGLDAARRHDQLWRDDELRPLRPRRRRGLNALEPSASRRDGAGCSAVRIAPRPDDQSSPGHSTRWRPDTVGSRSPSASTTALNSSSTRSSPKSVERGPRPGRPPRRPCPGRPLHPSRGVAMDDSFADLLGTLDLEGKVPAAVGRGLLHPARGARDRAGADGGSPTGPRGSGASSSSESGPASCRTQPCSRPRGARTPPARWAGSWPRRPSASTSTSCSAPRSTCTARRSAGACSRPLRGPAPHGAGWRRRTSEGCTERGIGACLKHFIANESETQRHTVDSRVDARTLRGLLPAAVRDRRPRRRSVRR